MNVWQEKKFLLVVTYGRSGSTLLLGVLNQIPGFRIYGENSNYLYRCFEAISVLEDPEQIGFERTTSTDPWYGYHLYKKVGCYVDIIQGWYDRMYGGDAEDLTHIGFKEVRYTGEEMPRRTEFLNFLLDSFPNILIVFNTRSWEPVSRSRWWALRDPAEVRSLVADCDQAFEDFLLRYPRRCFINRYERLISDDSALKELLEFLGQGEHFTECNSVLKIQHSI